MKIPKWILPGLVAVALALPGPAQKTGTAAVLWRDRGDVAMLNMLDGPGGKARAPGTNFKFIEESKGGSAPKFVVQDENGVRWKVKLGPEAKPETAAARLVWAAGYFVDEDYYRARIKVKGMKRLSQGMEYVSGKGLVKGARLERVVSGAGSGAGSGKHSEDWSWHETRATGTREFNGLRVLMALINNWDLKEVNNSVQDRGAAGQRYLVSDLGASFGQTGDSFTRSKGVLKDYADSEFIRKITPEHVDFVMHNRPALPLAVFNPLYYRERVRMESITKQIPIADARWLGNRLGRYSSAQIGDCFRAAGYSPAEVRGYSRVVLQRIAMLKKL